MPWAKGVDEVALILVAVRFPNGGSVKHIILDLMSTMDKHSGGFGTYLSTLRYKREPIRSHDGVEVIGWVCIPLASNIWPVQCYGEG